MDTIGCIKRGMSVRKFKPDPPLREALKKLVDIAKWCPSYKNSQPWECAIVSVSKR